MNKAYSLVWNEAQSGWCAVGETARRRGKSGGGKRLLAAGVSLLGLAAASGAYALPTGGEIASGKADIATSADNKTMSINQHTDKLITNWQDFSVGGGERVSFQQPTSQSIALNRVIGANGSQIHGQIDANGRVFLVNPNGVMFGAGAQVNVGGLVASTQNLSDVDFLAGRYRFAGTSGQSVENAGTITAKERGSVALLGARVSNTGVIRAQMGRVALGAGNAFNVNFDGNGLLNLQVEGGAVDAQAHNGGLLKADGGEVLMTARAAGDLLGSVVKNSGTIEAKGLSSRAGKITLDGGQVHVAGKLDASAQDASTAGGTVTTRGERVVVSRDVQVDTRASSGRTGQWAIEAANAGVDAAGHAITGETLSRNLGTTNVALTNTSGDLTVGDAVNWASDNTLALTSKKGSVDLKQSLTASGANAGVTVNAAQQIRIGNKVALTGENASLALNSGSGHTLTNDDAVVTLSGRNASFSANGEGYRVIHDLAGLRGVDGNMNGRYVLGNAIDGKGAQFRSLGGANAFEGVFDGLGNTISRLTINGNGQYVGLFGMNRGRIANLALDSFAVNEASTGAPASVGALAGANYGGTISNVRVTKTTVSSNGKSSNLVGGLVGDNIAGVIDGARFQGRIAANEAADSIGGIAGRHAFGALITNSHADAEITSMRSSNSMRAVGGLVGRNLHATVSDSTSAGRISVGDRMHAGGLVGQSVNGMIDNATSTVDVSAGKSSFVGGAVGRSDGGTILGSSARGTVRATDGSTVGGFIGLNKGGDIADSKAFGAVNAKGAAAIGGFAGENVDGGVLENVAANGSVSDIASSAVGGLVGRNAGMIRLGEAAGDVRAGQASSAGGLVAVNDGTIEQSKASGVVRAGSESRVGGLVGVNRGTISGSRATGSVYAARDSYAGGLVGENIGQRASIRGSKASGNVTTVGGMFVGGFAGWNNDGALIADSESSGTVAGTGLFAGGFAGVNHGAIRSSHTSSKFDYSEMGMPLVRGGFVAFNSGRIESSNTSGAGAREPFASVNVGWIDGKR
ncbi:GLUG motif-containing protein [Burkholderia pyrrocinia]|uniref:two-partner secretion domain-containing protein n=3 Tax=Burkholderia pyrrocinia TaxID=60550 RepID=UPI00064B86BF|nr:GLUG motif-containing protein [Burkholderia pyrrocinia]AKM02538.1 filamentous hemagglutinin [Burkholderia pyrrocinia]